MTGTNSFGGRQAGTPKQNFEKKNYPAEQAGPQARQPKRSGNTFRVYCIKVIGFTSRGSVADMIRVAAGIIRHEARLLICQRRLNAIFGGKWEFPGGKMRPSESPRQALRRELREELGVEAQIGDLKQITRHRYAEMSEPVQIFFLSAVLLGRPRNLAFERILWLRPEDLPHYDFLAADRPVLSRLAGGE